MLETGALLPDSIFEEAKGDPPMFITVRAGSWVLQSLRPRMWAQRDLRFLRSTRRTLGFLRSFRLRAWPCAALN